MPEKKNSIGLDTSIRYITRMYSNLPMVSNDFVDKVNIILYHILVRIVNDTVIITKNCKRKTIDTKDILSAAKIFLQTKDSNLLKQQNRAMLSHLSIYKNRVEQGITGSRTNKADLWFSVPKVENVMRANLPDDVRVTDKAIILLTSVVQYFGVFIMQKSGNEANKEYKDLKPDNTRGKKLGDGRKKVKDTHLYKALETDKLLKPFLDNI